MSVVCPTPFSGKRDSKVLSYLSLVAFLPHFMLALAANQLSVSGLILFQFYQNFLASNY